MLQIWVVHAILGQRTLRGAQIRLGRVGSFCLLKRFFNANECEDTSLLQLTLSAIHFSLLAG